MSTGSGDDTTLRTESARLLGQALIEEYKELHSEIREISRAHFEMLLGNLAFAGTAMSVAVGNPNAGEVALVVPLVSFVLAWLYREKAFAMDNLSSYILHGLGPRIAKLAGEGVFNWEDAHDPLRREWRWHTVLYKVSRIAVFHVGSMAALLWTAVELQMLAVHPWFWGVDAFLVLVSATSFWWFGKGYKHARLAQHESACADAR